MSTVIYVAIAFCVGLLIGQRSVWSYLRRIRRIQIGVERIYR